MYNENALLRPFWDRLFKEPWILGLLLILLWGIPRFIIVLLANKTGNYQWVSIIFITMWMAPWIFLSRNGRKKMGLKKPKRVIWLIPAFLLGGLLCLFSYWLADLFYSDSIDNWFVYISRSYSNLPKDLSPSDKWIYFYIYAGISMTFSPIGEEFFYRGIVHECFATKWSDRVASYADSPAFSITHLAHFGIIYHLGQWTFRAAPAMLWMLLLFFICIFFSMARKKSDSILGAVLAHAGFNLAMMYVIFFYIL